MGRSEPEGENALSAKLNDKVFALDNRVRKVQASLSDNTTHVLFCNSEGVTYYDYRPMVSYMAFCIMEENGRMENNYATRSYRKGFEFMTDDIIEVIAREVVDNTAIMFKAIKPKGGELPVVMASGGSGICCTKLSDMRLKLISTVRMFLSLPIS